MWSDNWDEYFTISPAGGGRDVLTGSKTQTQTRKMPLNKYSHPLSLVSVKTLPVFITCSLFPSSSPSLTKLPDWCVLVYRDAWSLPARDAVLTWLDLKRPQREERGFALGACRHFVSYDLVGVGTVRANTLEEKRHTLVWKCCKCYMFFSYS